MKTKTKTTRISLLAQLIQPCQVVVDVGSDHALLAQLLIANQTAQTVYNIEKNLGPFRCSQANTAHLANVINILSDGFLAFDPTIAIDYCVLAGMGVAKIVQIITLAQNAIAHFLFCTNENPVALRQFATNNAYYISQDFVWQDDKGTFYHFLLLTKDKKAGIKSKPRDWLLGSWSLRQNNPTCLLWLEQAIAKLAQINNLQQHNAKKYLELQKMRKTYQQWQSKSFTTK